MTKFSDLPILSFGNTVQIVGAIYAGDGKTFLLYFPDEREDFPIVPLDMSREDWTTFLRQTDLIEAEVLAKTEDGQIVKAIVRKGQRQIDAHLSWQVFKRDGYRCRYCANDSCPLTVDHLVLWEEGGPTIEVNLVSACRKCNKTRGNDQYADWLKHPRYREMSKKLTPEVRAANEALIGTIDNIPRSIALRSR